MPEIITAKEYNIRQMSEYSQRVDEWVENAEPHEIIPQIAFFGFRKEDGSFKNNGFVLINNRSHRWARTKRELKVAI